MVTVDEISRTTMRPRVWWIIYNPELGRFISEDPLGKSNDDLNMYIYVRNNPLYYIDPFGEVSWGLTALYKGLEFLVKQILNKTLPKLTPKGPGTMVSNEDELRQVERELRKMQRQRRQGCGIYRSCTENDDDIVEAIRLIDKIVEIERDLPPEPPKSCKE
ncbi:MAG: RHS repeat-associated core domain-containing protein [Bdellovibrionota bacterium]|nr:RHS repeat-associated core domain-containing protein [Bdellovibrionota bacterium]